MSVFSEFSNNNVYKFYLCQKYKLRPVTDDQLAIEQLFEGYKLVRVQQAGLEVTVDKLTADNQKLTAENKKIKGWLLKLLKQQGMEEAVAELQEHEDVVGVEDS